MLGLPDLPVLAAFAAAAAVLAVIPGPGMLYVAARTLGGGRRDGLLSTAGTALGGMVHVTAAALGLSALLVTSSVAFSIVKYAGAAYLIFLGLRMILRREEWALNGAPAESGRAAFRQGALTEALNPKTALFFLAILPQFVDPGRGSVLIQAAVLGTISVLFNTLADVGAVLLAGLAHRRLVRRPVQWPRVVSGCTLIGLGGLAALESRS